jgi:hypothetical protein
MKHLKIIIYFLLVAGSTGISGCDKFVEKGNVNINPNQPSTITLNTLLPAVEYSTANSQTSVAYITSMFTQTMAAYSSGPINDDQHRDVRISTGFSTIYQNGLNNSKILIDLATSQGSPHYAAIGRILFVTNLQLATDTWGDVPLTEAFKAPEILQPKYDAQQGIYDYMFAELDKAIAEIAQANPASLKPGIDDIMYAGAMTKWKEAAYFMKARLYSHLTKRGLASATTNALTALASGFSASANDFQLSYSDKLPNPWHVNVSGRISGSAVYTIGPSQRFLNATTGVLYAGLFDPRIDKLVAKSGTGTTYTGLSNGGGNNSINNTNLTEATFYAGRTSPLVIGSFAEQKLMEAEMRFLANGGTATSVGSTPEAYTAYKAGIVAHLAKLGLPATYANDPQVDVGASKLTLELILREKQVALYLNPEAWTDMRRYDYNPNLFKGMSLPLNQNTEMGGQQIRRAMYPLDEINRNPNAQAALKAMTDKVWWDQ